MPRLQPGSARPRGSLSTAYAALMLLACESGRADESEAKSVGRPVNDASPPTARVSDEPPNDDELARRYLAAKAILQGDTRSEGTNGNPSIAAQRDLELIANQATDRHLRANASILLGSVYERSQQLPQAVAFYRHATKLVPDDAGPHMTLALALAASGDFRGAAQVQKTATDLDPDNLENWLTLGEMLIKAGDEDGATKAYAGYEMRRRGLLEGLTAKTDGKYDVAPEERAGCALALASASDNGTALALLFALESDPDPKVRVAVARTMGIQRLRGYEAPLRKHSEKESDPDVLAALKAALAEIERDPLDSTPGPAPLTP